jgi:hypothetical protein
LPLPPLYTKSGGKTINAASIKKALAMSQPILKPKTPISLFQGRFCGRTKQQTSLEPHSGTFNGGKGVKMIRKPSYLLHMATVDIFCLVDAKLKPADLSLSEGGLMTN